MKVILPKSLIEDFNTENLFTQKVFSHYDVTIKESEFFIRFEGREEDLQNTLGHVYGDYDEFEING